MRTALLPAGAHGTLAKAKFDVIDKKGVLTATCKDKRIFNRRCKSGQIEIVSADDDESAKAI